MLIQSLSHSLIHLHSFSWLTLFPLLSLFLSLSLFIYIYIYIYIYNIQKVGERDCKKASTESYFKEILSQEYIYNKNGYNGYMKPIFIILKSKFSHFYLYCIL